MSKEKDIGSKGDKKKERQEKYEAPLIIDGSFDDVLSLIVEGNPKPKKKDKEKK